jgi:hypothetical protein
MNKYSKQAAASAAGGALLLLSCLLGVPGRAEATSGTAHANALSVSLANPSFAIADFDGDRKPDLATVEVQKANASFNTRYSIRFQLSSGGAWQEFGVIAPAGGLQIVARDVNGDSALDLLVSTAWEHQQVAVLLNDGHGNFTLADPGGFPDSIWGNESQWNSESVPFCDSAALPRSPNSPDGGEGEIQIECAQRQVGLASSTLGGGSPRLLLFSLLGRAPPRFVH